MTRQTITLSEPSPNRFSRFSKPGVFILTVIIFALLIFQFIGQEPANTDQWQLEMLGHSLQAMHYLGLESQAAFELLVDGEFDEEQWKLAWQQIHDMRNHLLAPAVSLYKHPQVIAATDPNLVPSLDAVVYDLQGSVLYWEEWYPKDLGPNLEYSRWALQRTAEAALPVLERITELTNELVGIEAGELLVLLGNEDPQTIALLGDLLVQLTELGPALLSECST